MLSGIGPRDQLEKFSIKRVADLPVGQNLQDHCMVLQTARIHKPEGSMTMSATTLLNPLNFLEFYLMGTGQLTSNYMGIVGVINSPSNMEMERPGKIFSTFYNVQARADRKSQVRKC